MKEDNFRRTVLFLGILGVICFFLPYYSFGMLGVNLGISGYDILKGLIELINQFSKLFSGELPFKKGASESGGFNKVIIMVYLTFKLTGPIFFMAFSVLFIFYFWKPVKAFINIAFFYTIIYFFVGYLFSKGIISLLFQSKIVDMAQEIGGMLDLGGASIAFWLFIILMIIPKFLFFASNRNIEKKELIEDKHLNDAIHSIARNKLLLINKEEEALSRLNTKYYDLARNIVLTIHNLNDETTKPSLRVVLHHLRISLRTNSSTKKYFAQLSDDEINNILTSILDMYVADDRVKTYESITKFLEEYFSK